MINPIPQAKASPKMRLRQLLAFASTLPLLLLGLAATTSLYAQPTATTTRVSVATGGTQANEGSYSSAISADGRFVAFHSDATNLVNGDTNGKKDVFVHDRQTGQTTRVSVTTDGNQADGDSEDPSLSADGRYVAFHSGATNLVVGDNNGFQDIFVHDRQTGETTRVSVATGGTQANYYSVHASISGDGRYVAFESGADNLAASDKNPSSDIYLHDREEGKTWLVSAEVKQAFVYGSSVEAAISADGRYVAFASANPDLIDNDTNDEYDILVRDLQTHTTTRVSVASNGTQSNLDSFYPSLSEDGRYVTFESIATNLVTGDTNSVRDIFVHDRETSQTVRVSIASDGTQANKLSYPPVISADGRYVTFASDATNLVNGDTNGATDIFVHDRQTGQTSRVSVASNGSQSSSFSVWPVISADGNLIAFESQANNLVDGDTNYEWDIFVRGADSGCTAKPAKPTLKSPADHATTNKTRVKLKWNAAECAETYNVKIQDAATGKTVDSATGLTELKYKTIALTKGKTYKWFVQAVNGNGKTKSVKRTFTLQ